MADRWQQLYGAQLHLASPNEWAELVPQKILEETAREHGGDQRAGKLTAPVHFWLLVVGTLSPGCPSLKALIGLFEKTFGFLRPSETAAGSKPWLTPAAVSQRNQERSLTFWVAMFLRLKEWHFGQGWMRKAWQKRFAGIEALDSSTFRLMARLVQTFKPSGSGGPKAQSRNRRGALKLHQVYAVGEELPDVSTITPAAAHDSTAWRDVLDLGRKGILYLFDRGYCDFRLWQAVVQAASFFVTPLKTNLEYRHVRWLNPKRQRQAIRDQLVRFPGLDALGKPVVLRLVEIQQTDGRWWGYVTNLADPHQFAPADVASLYRLRWRIELFFPTLEAHAGHAALVYRERDGRDGSVVRRVDRLSARPGSGPLGQSHRAPARRAFSVGDRGVVVRTVVGESVFHGPVRGGTRVGAPDLPQRSHPSVRSSNLTLVRG